MNARLYDGPEHESLRAVWRSMIACFGATDANRRLDAFLAYFKVQSHGELSPEGANYARKLLEKQLPPLRGECVS